MPVRPGFPVGVKGITQLVQGPQYATGVGLVRYGATQLWEARQRTDSEIEIPLHAPTSSGEPVARKNGLWGWLKAAF